MSNSELVQAIRQSALAWVGEVERLASSDHEIAEAEAALAALQSRASAILLALGHSKAAPVAYGQALQLAPIRGENAYALAEMLKAQGQLGDAVRVMERFISQGSSNYAQITEYGRLLLDFGDFEAAAPVLDRAHVMKAKPLRERMRDLALRRANDDLEAGISGAQKRAYLTAAELLVFEHPALAEMAFLEVARSCPGYAPAWLGLRGARHAMGHVDATETTETQCRDTPGHPPDQVIQAIMARPLSRRGLVFDPDEPIRWRSKDESFVEVKTAGDLRTTPNSRLVIRPGRELIKCGPVVLFGLKWKSFRPPSFRSIEQSMLAVSNAAVVGRGQVLTEANEIIREVAEYHISEKYDAERKGDELRFDPVFFGLGRVDIRCFDHPAILLAGPTDNSFGDWVNNFLPKLGLAEDVGLDCPVLVSYSIRPQFIDMMVALGVKRERIVFHDPRGVSIFPKLYVPSWTVTRDRSIRGVYKICERAEIASPRRKGALIYLSRRNTPFRPLVNEAQVRALFVSKGFEVVEPETLTFDEVREVFAAPACVAGPYGSAFHNLVFSSNRPLCLALTSPTIHRMIDDITRWFGMAGLQVAYVRGVDHGVPATDRDGIYDGPWIVDLDKVEQAIDRLMSMLGRDVVPART